MIRRTASSTSSTHVVACVTEHGARKLTIAHFRAFLEQVDIAGFGDDIPVTFEMSLQATSPYYDIKIRAQVSESVTSDLADKDVAEDGHHEDG
jgi:hypothetical protein